MKKILVAAVAMMLVAPMAHAAGENDAAIRKLVDSTIRAWISDPLLVDAIRSQNKTNSGLTQSNIDALDMKWRAEIGSGVSPTIDEILGRPASKRLLGFKNKGEGLFTEIFVMDSHGLNVAQSDATSDYWQGDEAKWKKTFLVGPDAVFVDDVEFDESTQTYQAQVSLAIADPDSGAVIGAITVGVNVELLSH